MYLNEHYQMKKTILAVFLTFAFLQSNSCSCFEGFKGYKDYPMTLGLAAKVIQQIGTQLPFKVNSLIQG